MDTIQKKVMQPPSPSGSMKAALQHLQLYQIYLDANTSPTTCFYLTVDYSDSSCGTQCFQKKTAFNGRLICTFTGISTIAVIRPKNIQHPTSSNLRQSSIMLFELTDFVKRCGVLEGYTYGRQFGLPLKP